MRWLRWPDAAVAAALVALLLVDGAVVLLHDEATPYDAGSALADFRRQAAAPASSSPAAVAGPTALPLPSAAPSSSPPAPTAAATARAAAATPAALASSAAGPREVPAGVYRYATSGHEQVDVLGGARHDYPSQTTISYQRGGCGSQDRWQPLKERYSLDLVCRGPQGLELRSTMEHHEFFGQSEDQELACSPGLVLVADDPRPGATRSGRCRGGDTVVDLVVRIEDVSTMAVGGRQVQVIHLRVDGQLSGATRGATHRQEWVTRAGLLVHGTASIDTDRDTSAGTVHYAESYDLRLLSLDPQR